MCNDKQGMGAPPKPKQPAVSQLLENQQSESSQEFDLSRLIKCNIIIIVHSVAKNDFKIICCRQQLASSAWAAKLAQLQFLSHPSSP